jgi:hypothetical protein
VSASIFTDRWQVDARAICTRCASSEPAQLPFQLTEFCEFWIMTFIIEATKDDHHTADIRFSAVVAVILARKLVEDGFAVSIRAPGGRQYSADQFNLLLTSKGSNSQGMTDDG